MVEARREVGEDLGLLGRRERAGRDGRVEILRGRCRERGLEAVDRLAVVGRDRRERLAGQRAACAARRPSRRCRSPRRRGTCPPPPGPPKPRPWPPPGPPLPPPRAKRGASAFARRASMAVACALVSVPAVTCASIWSTMAFLIAAVRAVVETPSWPAASAAMAEVWACGDGLESLDAATAAPPPPSAASPTTPMAARRRSLPAGVLMTFMSRYLFRVVGLMNPSDQRPVRATKEPRRRSHRVAAWPAVLSGSTTACRARRAVCGSRTCDVAALAERFGTPLSVISEDQLRRNARRFTSALEAAWPEGPARVLPSIKANYTLALRCALTQEGFGCDVFGPAELHAALAGGVPPQLISVNGTGKTRALLEQRRRHRRARDARQRQRDRARARGRARRSAGVRRCASACDRATSSCSSRPTSPSSPCTRPRRSTSPGSRPRS